MCLVLVSETNVVKRTVHYVGKNFAVGEKVTFYVNS